MALGYAGVVRNDVVPGERTITADGAPHQWSLVDVTGSFIIPVTRQFTTLGPGEPRKCSIAGTPGSEEPGLSSTSSEIFRQL